MYYKTDTIPTIRERDFLTHNGMIMGADNWEKSIFQTSGQHPLYYDVSICNGAEKLHQ
jgi:hypothetical protein